MADWNSESVRQASVYDNNFKPSIVLVNEDSPSISQFVDYLDQTAASGIRPKFTSINAASTEQKVQSFLSARQANEIPPSGQQKEELMDMNLWAEAIKHFLLQMKPVGAAAVPRDLEKLKEITGARSKDLLRYIPLIGPSENLKSEPVKKQQKIAEAGDAQNGGNKRARSKKKKKTKKENGGESVAPPTTTTQSDTDGPENGGAGNLKKKSLKKKDKSKTKSGTDDDDQTDTEEKGKKKVKGSSKKGKGKKKLGQVIRTVSLPLDSSNKGQVRHTLLRKRGEPQMPLVTVADDSPKDGPQLYVLLQGFYNPDILDALNKIGVKVDGIILLTEKKIEKRNFSLIDLEENFVDAFKPQNILPDYLQKIEEKTEGPDKVTKFWLDFASKLSKAPPNSFIHDLALLNCELPFASPNPSPDELGVHSVRLLDEVAKRMYEMNVLKNWHETYKAAAKVKMADKIEADPMPPDSVDNYPIYGDLMTQIPAECVTLPVIMDNLLAQVVHAVEMGGSGDQKLQNYPTDPANPDSDMLAIFPTEEIFKAHKKSVKNKNRKSTSKNDKKSEKNSFQNEPPSQEQQQHQQDQPMMSRSRRKSRRKSFPKLNSDDLNFPPEFLDQNPIRGKSILPFDVSNLGQTPLVQDHLHLEPGQEELVSHDQYSGYYDDEEEDEEEDGFNGNQMMLSTVVVDKRRRPYLSDEVRKKKSLDLCRKEPKQKNLSAQFKGPLYIKSHDFASMRTCHLDEETAAAIAASQVTGDFFQNRHFLWEGIPPFCKELYLKLHGNLMHFMHFLPIEELDLKDMFFIIHLLLAKGVQQHLEKKGAQNSAQENDCSAATAANFGTKLPDHCKKNIDTPQPENFATGTLDLLLDPSHNYLAIGQELEETTKFILASEDSSPKKFNVVLPPRENSTIDKIHGAAVATKKIVMTAAEIAEQEAEEMEAGLKKQPVTPPNTATATAVERLESIHHLYFGSSDGTKNEGQPRSPLSREDDLDVLKSLIDCPALLALSDSGALDLSKWVETYLLSSGLSSRGAGGEPLVGQVNDWHWAEELVPVQMTQALSEASKSYLCMERMYCPFYDTILLIFYNPTPDSLQAEASFVSKLQTLPGLQHFLEYVINDQEVMNFVMDAEKRKGPLQSVSVETLMRLIPENQWILIPSIKYKLKKMAKQKLDDFAEIGGEHYEKMDESKASPQTRKMVTLDPTKKKQKRQRQTIDLGDDDDNDSIDDQDRNKTSRSNNDPTTNSETENGMTTGKSGDDVNKRKKKKKKGKKNRKNDSENRGKSKDSEKSETDNEKPGSASKKKKKQKKGKSKSGTDPVTTSEGEFEENFEKKSKKPEIESPFPVLTLEGGSLTELFRKESVDRNSKTDATDENPKKLDSHDDHESDMRGQSGVKNFNVYDLGKRLYIVTSDDYHLFPMDGTLISYNVSTIEPDFRMMQLKLVKNGHSTIFYPYYFSHDASEFLAGQPFVLCPHFHAVLANGTLIVFEDKRVTSRTPTGGGGGKVQSNLEKLNIFGVDQIKFFDQHATAVLESRLRHSRNDFERKNSKFFQNSQSAPIAGQMGGEELIGENDENLVEGPELEEAKKEPIEEVTRSSTSSERKKKKKSKKEKSKDGSSGKKSEKKKKKEQAGKKLKKEGEKNEKLSKVEDTQEQNEEGETEEGSKVTEEMREAPSSLPPPQPPVGEWNYPSSDETDAEDSKRMHQPSSTFLTFGWDEAQVLLTPLVHRFKVTLPSGLFIDVGDVEGSLPLTREVKQTYLSTDSAFPLVETCRYYTMNGSVVRFLGDGTIQILNARGVTTNIREISAHVPNGDDTENLREKFEKAHTTKIFKGDVIMPNGEFWHISNGRRSPCDPLFVFTSGTMANGEIFRRRQDGTIYIHRSDGCCIVHFPDGTRFTTRLVIQKDPDPDFWDWEFVGLKYMIEHPNYAPVIFNTLSGNIHIRLPQGEWARIFSDGTIRFGSVDDYKLDVTPLTATLSCPILPQGDLEVPNLTVVKLYHTPPLVVNDNALSQPSNESKHKSIDSTVTKGGSLTLVSSRSSRMSMAGPLTKGLMDQNMRPPFRGPSVVTQSSTSFIRGLPHAKRSIKTGTLDDESGRQDLSSIKRKLGSQNFSLEAGTGAAADATDTDADDGEEEGVAGNILVKKFEIQEFLTFTDTWTLLKAIDTFDNRFALDLYGNTVVDKGQNYTEKDGCYPNPQRGKKGDQNLGTKLVNKVPQSRISSLGFGDEFNMAHGKGANFMKKLMLDACCQKIPPTRIFVVKRDFSGYEFLKETTVQKLSKRAKNNPEAMITSDPLPKKEGRQFLTIMEPVEDTMEGVSGNWKNLYREPVFKPRYLCNKNLKVAGPQDLRWFAYILAQAHGKRGNYFKSPKEEFLQGKKDKRIIEEDNHQKTEKAEQNLGKVETTEVPQMDEASGENKEEKVEKVGKKEVKGKKKSKEKPEKGKKGKSKDSKGGDEKNLDKKIEGKKSKKTKKNKPDTSKKSEDIAMVTSDQNDESSGSKKNSRSKRSRKKKLGKIVHEEPKPEVIEMSNEEEEEEEETELPESDQKVPESESTRQRLGTEPPAEYPEGVRDVKGLYGPSSSEDGLAMVTPYRHVDILPQRQAMVVKTIVEMPKLDDTMQKILLEASTAYAKSVEEQKRLLTQHAGSRDPRSEAEREEEERVWREFVEQNLEAMHFLEQSAAKLLDIVL